MMSEYVEYDNVACIEAYQWFKDGDFPGVKPLLNLGVERNGIDIGGATCAIYPSDWIVFIDGKLKVISNVIFVKKYRLIEDI